VLVAIQHLVMRRYTCRLLARACGCQAVSLAAEEVLAQELAGIDPDLLIFDTADFPACCGPAAAMYPPQRVIVVGPESCEDYRHAALTGGAAGWVARDSIGEELPAVVNHLLDAPPAGTPPSGTPHCGPPTRRNPC